MSKTLDTLNDKYFNWMYDIVCDCRCSKRPSYRKLLKSLHDKEFVYTIELDSNRAEDGKDLRYRFAYDYDYYNAEQIGRYLDVKPCSVLEMMVALVIRCEEHIMDNPDIGDRTGYWFWNMISNLGLDSMDDNRFDEYYVDRIIDRFLYRKYKPNGEGGLFTVQHCRHDLRDVEIWYQLMWYLDDI